MLTSEERERIRRAYYIDHKSVRHISLEQRHSRDTINRIITENPLLEFIGESYRFLQRLRQEEQKAEKSKTDVDSEQQKS